MQMKREKNRIKEPFVAITYEMMDSKAFKELNGSTVKALIYCLRKVKTHNQFERYQLQFTFTYPEASKKGLGHSSFNRSIKQLQAFGFIDCVMKGGMRFQGKACSQYRLSKRWKAYGTANFKSRHDGYCESIHGK